jgi:hypothetical protein
MLAPDVRLDGFLLANYAEAPTGALTVVGGGWDTVNVTAPPEPMEGEDDPPVASLQGALVVRLLLRPEECGQPHPFVITLLDDDEEIARIEGELGADRAPELPASWEQALNMTFPLMGLALPNFGLYRFTLMVGGEHIGEARMQVIKRY